MQADNNQIIKSKDVNPSTNHIKEFYNASVLKSNALSELCYEITSTETFDHNFLVEIADNFIENLLDAGCKIAKHKKSDALTATDLKIAIEKNYEISEPTSTNQIFTKIKANEIKNLSTADHKKRIELTREEYKNIN